MSESKTNVTTKTKPTVFRRRIVVERDEQFDGCDYCLVMWSDGDVRHYKSPAAVLRAVKRADKRGAQGNTMCVTEIEWRDGLIPPGKEAD